MFYRHPIFRLLIFTLPLLLIFSLLVFPLLSTGFYDEDDWYHLVFGKDVIEEGFFKANIPQMLIDAPQFTSEHVRAIFVLQYWWAIAYKAFGATPIFHHLVACLLILLGGLAGFGIVAFLTGSKKTALAAACLFVLFPLNPRLIASGAAIVYPLLTFFFMVSVFFYIAFLKESEKKSKKRWRQALLYIVSFLFCLLAILTQESAYGLPILILFLDLIVSNSDNQGQVVGTFKKTKFIKPIFRSAPFILALVSTVEYTTSLAYENLSSEKLESHYFDFIGIPLIKLFSVVPEGFVTPFYKGYGRNAGVVFAAGVILLVVSGLIIAFWKSQKKPALLFGLGWIVICALPILQVLDRVIFPDETEEKYLFLPMFGFVMLLALACNSGTGGKRVSRMLGAGSFVALLILYLIGFYGNAGFFINKGQHYAVIRDSFTKVADASVDTRVITLVYHKNQQSRELQLAAFLEYTFKHKTDKKWFFIDKARFHPISVEMQSEKSAPALEKELSDYETPVGKRKSKFKFPSFFSEITITVNPTLAVWGIDPESGKIVDIKARIFTAIDEQNIPRKVDLAQFMKNRYRITKIPIKTDVVVDHWILKGFVYPVYPGIGRF